MTCELFCAPWRWKCGIRFYTGKLLRRLWVLYRKVDLEKLKKVMRYFQYSITFLEWKDHLNFDLTLTFFRRQMLVVLLLTDTWNYFLAVVVMCFSYNNFINPKKGIWWFRAHFTIIASILFRNIFLPQTRKLKHYIVHLIMHTTYKQWKV